MTRRAGILAGLTLLAAACEVEEEVNFAPQVKILSHYAGQTVDDGFVTSLQAEVLDFDDGPTDLVVTWTVNDEVVCENTPPGVDDVAFCEHIFLPGSASLGVFVTDSANNTAEMVIDLSVNETEVPTAEIREPLGFDTLYHDVPIGFGGVVDDGEESPKVLLVWWTSDLDGEIGALAEPDFTGSVFGEGTLSEGTHEVVLHAQDSTGKVGTDSTTVVVGPSNTQPTCAILSPLDVPIVAEGDKILFTAEAADIDVSPTNLQATWTSSIDGQFGMSSLSSVGETQINAELSRGTHDVTLTVHDDQGAACTDTVSTVINGIPIVTIAQPIEGSTYASDVEIPFSASVWDYEDDLALLDVGWRSNRQGVFNLDAPSETGVLSFGYGDLEPGEHVLTLSVSDSYGFSTEASVSIVID